MKNLLLVLATALIALPALATPKVGDHADYNATVSKDGKSATGVAALELTAYNATAKEYTQKTTIQWNGQSPQSQNDQVKEDDLLTDAVIDALLVPATCAQNGGKIESITVAAGTFSTCSLPNSDNGTTSNVWIGKVPLGTVKFTQTANGVTETFELKASKAGN